MMAIKAPFVEQRAHPRGRFTNKCVKCFFETVFVSRPQEHTNTYPSSTRRTGRFGYIHTNIPSVDGSDYTPSTSDGAPRCSHGDSAISRQ